MYWLKSPGLIAHWKLDETEGMVAYDSIGDNHGALNGDPNWQPDAGKVAGALQFDGIDDYVNVEAVLNPAKELAPLISVIQRQSGNQLIRE